MLWIRDFLVRIRIRGSVPLTKGSGSESCKFIAHLIRSQVTELMGGSLFMFEDEAGQNFRTKKKKFWPVFDLDPNPGFWSGFETGIRIRIRIWNKRQAGSWSEIGSETFVSDPQTCQPMLWIRDVNPGSRILIFIHPGSQIPDLGSWIQKQQQKKGVKKN